jgi:nicotinamidase/pyrazinamidase
LLDEMGAERCVVYGVVTEICVKHALFGLLKTGRSVELVTDAVKSLDEDAAAQMIVEFTAQGGKLTCAGALCAGEN